jgi:hypothetical protein
MTTDGVEALADLGQPLVNAGSRSYHALQDATRAG